ncbi:MAG: RNA-binding protein [Paraglaciecola sp.]|uniref:RNA recognition motif domain-containing protein n=1 Tax=Paraglaciecola sp. TaxID=1920173 RepID=UPI003265FC61
MKILIRNLDRATTEDELMLLFAEYGAVQSCNLVVDSASGKSKGFGFVEMPKTGEAKAAIKNLNYKVLGDNKIRVKKAEDKTAENPTD